MESPRLSIAAMGLVPLLLFALYAPFSGESDLWIAKYFYHNGQFENSYYLEWIYHYAIIPGWILALSGCALLFGKWRRIGLFIVLTLALGAGLIVHAALKDHWGRPRPKQTIEFGGTQAFRPFYKPNFFQQPEPSKSFPCGHCTMGFYFFTIMLLGIHFRNRVLFWSGFGLSILIGGALGYARIAQGGHYLSDVIASGLIMWLAAVCLYYLCIKKTC